MFDSRKGLRPALVLLFICLVPGLAYAQTATLAWDASPDATGYTVRWGQTAGKYTESRDVGNLTSTDISGLTPGVTYYSVVEAYANGMSSAPSNMLQFVAPVSVPV